MTSGIESCRLPSVATCGERKWRVGTVIESSTWSCRRRIKEIGEKFVTVVFLSKNTNSGERVKSFPGDVQATTQ